MPLKFHVPFHVFRPSLLCIASHCSVPW